jgi:hypothetical protein|tara:strand:- start:17304 stop:17699 length:396 start_codon:yes stop_codon:yes gene_type:complete
MSKYLAIQLKALSAIGKAGGDAVISRPFGGTLDPVTDVSTGDVIVSTTTKAVRLPASGGKIQAFDAKFKEDLKKGLITFFYIAAGGMTFSPEAGDKMTFGGKNWVLAGATPLIPDGLTPLIYAAGAKESVT